MNPLKTLQFILAHPFNRGRPLQAVAGYFAWQLRSRLSDEATFEWVGGTKLVARRGMTGATGNIYCGLHEFRDMSLVLHALRPGDVFVDVGANIGSYTILASGVCGARTVAVEPDAGTAQHLDRNITANGLDALVNIQRTAVGDQSGTITFTRGLDTMNRVALEGDKNVQSVPLARLDDLLSDVAPTLVKLDVEGFETAALRGAEAMLAKPSLLAVLLETVDPEALAILTRHGFVELDYDPAACCLVRHAEWSRGSNALFVRDRERLQDRLSGSPARTFRGQRI